MNRQHTAPMIVRDGMATPLRPVPLSEKSLSEGWLQGLLFDHPSLIPAGEIEPVFGDLIPLARELQTPSGRVDVVYITPDGFLALVETKLWRNPDSRRSVVAQIIDYAKDIARWSLSDLEQAVSQARRGDRVTLASLVAEALDDEDFDERRFNDVLARNLRLGRFLLLIVGDGIREDVEHMASYLQHAPQLGFTLGLVEIALFRDGVPGGDEIYAQPRVVARTREVTRAVVELREGVSPEQVTISVPEQRNLQPSVRRGGLTAEAYLEVLARSAGVETVELVREILDLAPEHRLRILIGDGGPMLKFDASKIGADFTFGQIDLAGRVASLWPLPYRCRRLGLPESVWKPYFDDLKRIVPGTEFILRKTSKSESFYWVLSEDPSPANGPPVLRLQGHLDEWFSAIEEAIERIEAELDERS